MSDSGEPSRKRAKSGQERQADYRKKNPDYIKLSKEKEKLEILKNRCKSEQYDEDYKRKERERKAAYRAKKALEAKTESNKENDKMLNIKTEPEENCTQTKKQLKSRQAIQGLQNRRINNMEKMKLLKL